jgi:copper resistance protein D
MDAIVKASLYIGTILLVGAGSYVHFINPHFVTRPMRVSRILISAVLTGLGLIMVGSILSLTLTVMNALGARFNAAFVWEYATSTQHGSVTFVRLALALLLVPLVLVLRWPKVRVVLFSLAGLGFLATFSILSHATSMNGTPAFFADLIHFSSASLWLGAVVFSVFHKIWRQPEFETVMKRVSSLALLSVVLLVSTGIYSSLIHIKTFALLFGTEYGRVLLVKVSVFSLVLVLAAFNRWYFMPKLLARRVAFQRILIVEVCLLVTVLVVTGLLTVSPVPHDMARN